MLYVCVRVCIRASVTRANPPNTVRYGCVCVCSPHWYYAIVHICSRAHTYVYVLSRGTYGTTYTVYICTREWRV